MIKAIKYAVRIISTIGCSFMLCIWSIKTFVFLSEAGVDESSYRICGGFILVGTMYLLCLILWYIGLGKEGYEEYKARKRSKKP